MPSAAELAWLIPVLPLVGAFITGLGLISFNRTVNRLRKPVALLLITSTRDDRVHPGHARKMAARLRENGYSPMYYENIEGGHGGAADNAQRADMSALEFAFLWRHLARR
jgi:prolyl oligopeptidase PreP (S9A serine peptidase family)